MSETPAVQPTRSTQPRRIAVVSAGLSQPSSTRLLADRLAEATEEELRSAGGQVQLDVIELRDLAHQITDNLLTGFPAPTLEEAISTVVNADGLIVVTPIFSASYSGLFKSFIDVIDKDALVGKPTMLAATGGSARHSLSLEHAMRPLFAYLRAATIPTAVFAASEDWGNVTGSGDALAARIRRAGTELAGYVTASPERESGPDDLDESDLLANLIPFEQLRS